MSALVSLAAALDGVLPPCRLDPDLWFPEPGGDAEDLALAARVCVRDCPAAVECLAYAREVGARVGVWGGVLLGRVVRDERAVAS